jgi:hypothetical protein
MDGKLKKGARALIGYILMGIATTNCYLGWKPQDDLDWLMWTGNFILGIVALVYIFKGPKLNKE